MRSHQNTPTIVLEASIVCGCLLLVASLGAAVPSSKPTQSQQSATGSSDHDVEEQLIGAYWPSYAFGGGHDADDNNNNMVQFVDVLDTEGESDQLQQLLDGASDRAKRMDGSSSMPGVLRFGKRARQLALIDDLMANDGFGGASLLIKKEMPGVLRFGKRAMPGVLRFGKRDATDLPAGVLRFGKRNVPAGVLRFGRRR